MYVKMCGVRRFKELQMFRRDSFDNYLHGLLSKRRIQ
ncbi:hypothetical protein RF55_24215, partial [Lasius niger]